MHRLFFIILTTALLGALATGSGAVLASDRSDDVGACSESAGHDAGDDTGRGMRTALAAEDRTGTDADDRIDGSGRDDRLSGGDGDDDLCGEAGDDDLRGGAGDDDLRGGAGDDRLTGGSGRDSLTGGPGHDVLSGGPGNDTVHARDGRRDRVTCGTGDDRIAADREDRVARDCEHVTRR